METSIDKTKRKLLQEVNNPHYKYQTRILFEDTWFERDGWAEIVTIFPEVRAKLSRKFKYKALWYLRTYDNRPYIQFFTNEKPPVTEIKRYLGSSLKLDIQSVRTRSFTDEMKASWTNTVRKQNLSQLEHLKTKEVQVIRRWSVTGRNLK